MLYYLPPFNHTLAQEHSVRTTQCKNTFHTLPILALTRLALCHATVLRSLAFPCNHKMGSGVEDSKVPFVQPTTSVLLMVSVRKDRLCASFVDVVLEEEKCDKKRTLWSVPRI